MKRIFCLLALAATVSSYAQNAKIHVDKPASIKGQSLLSWVNPEFEKFDASNGVITVPLAEPRYFTLGGNLLYLSPGDELTVVLDGRSPAKTTFSGRGAAINDFLSTRNYPNAGSLFTAMRVDSPSFETAMPIFDSIVTARRATVAALDAPEAFKRTENARIDADYLNSLLFFPNRNPRVYGDDYRGLTRENFTVRDRQFMTRIEPMARPLLEKLAADPALAEIEDVRTTLAQYAERAHYNLVLAPRLRTAMQAAEMASQRTLNGGMTERQFAEREEWGRAVPEADLREAFLARLEPYRQHTEANAVIDVPATTLEGVQKMLSDFRGKPIYVDVWATWCGPCKAMAPYYEELSEEFPDIQFIAISIDKDRKVWERFTAGKPHGRVIELWGGDAVAKAWQVSGVPRFLLIDKNFDLVSSDALRPTLTREIKEALSALR